MSSITPKCIFIIKSYEILTFFLEGWLHGTTTFSIMTLSIMTFSTMTLCLTTLCIMTFSIMTQSILIICDTQHSGIQYRLLSVFYGECC
jgi:hypothetical protein